MAQVLMFSGGMDSLCAWYLKRKPRCIFVEGHSRYSWKEAEAVERLQKALPELDVITIALRMLAQFEQLDATIPLRNSFFAHIGALYGEHVLIPCQLGEQNIPDRSPQFFQEISKLLSYLQDRHIVVDPVFPELTKQDVVALYLSAGGSPNLLHETYSCSSEKAGKCGECQMCLRTAVALEYNEILPEKFFQNDIWSWSGTKVFAQRLQQGEYEERRTEQSLQVLRKHLKIGG